MLTTNKVVKDREIARRLETSATRFMGLDDCSAMKGRDEMT